MHELGIAQDLWAVIKHKALENNLKKITKIAIVIGEASGIEEDFLRHSLVDHVLPGSFAEKAVLEIRPELLKAKCSQCGKEITKDNIVVLRCPHCQGMKTEIIAGKETYVHSIEGE